MPAAASLIRATGSKLPVTSASRNSEGRADNASSSSTIPGATFALKVVRAEPLVLASTHASSHGVVDLGHADGGEQIARDRAVRAPRVLHAVHAEQVDAVTAPAAVAQRERVFHGGPLQQRAVDVEQQ